MYLHFKPIESITQQLALAVCPFTNALYWYSHNDSYLEVLENHLL